MSLAPYPVYKPSGSDWLGDVPTGWDVKRLRFLVSEPLQYGANEAAEFQDRSDPRYIRITDVKSDGNLRNDTFRSLPKTVAQPYMLSDGDILFARSGATVGKTFIYRPSWGRAAFAGYLIKARIKVNVNAQFIYHFVNSGAYWDWLNSVFIQSTIQNVSAEKYAELRISIPPLNEQKVIAGFLDERTGAIDALIAKKQDLLKLLAEKRTALITHAVTKGLNPNAPMKPSGIDWLGDVPKGWDVFPLSYLTNIGMGYAFSSEEFVSKGAPLIRISDVLASGVVSLKKVKYLPRGYLGKYYTYLVSRSDILMAMTGATVGKSGIYNHNENALLNQRVCRIRAKITANQKYIFYILETSFYFEYIWLTAFGGAQPNISDKEIMQCRVPIPSINEQKDIAEYLDKKTTQLDAVKAKTEEIIKRLKEYRAALITNAVTGKIKVV